HLILPPRTFAPSKRRENSLVSFKAGGTAVGRSSPPGHAKVPWRRCLHIALPRLSPSPPRLVASGYDHRVLSLGLSVETGLSGLATVSLVRLRVRKGSPQGDPGGIRGRRVDRTRSR